MVFADKHCVIIMSLGLQPGDRFGNPDMVLVGPELGGVKKIGR
jgi:hypothetical protein